MFTNVFILSRFYFFNVYLFFKYERFLHVWSVWRQSDVCLSVAYVGPKSRTERPRKTKIGTKVAHATRDSDTTFKVKGQLARGWGILWRPPTQLIDFAMTKLHSTKRNDLVVGERVFLHWINFYWGKEVIVNDFKRIKIKFFFVIVYLDCCSSSDTVIVIMMMMSF